jgi:hypothetical protein
MDSMREDKERNLQQSVRREKEKLIAEYEGEIKALK